jgi:hypothetical protein
MSTNIEIQALALRGIGKRRFKGKEMSIQLRKMLSLKAALPTKL